MGEEDIKLAVIANDIGYIKEAIQTINDRLDKNYITQAEFEPVKRIVYGIMFLIVTGIVGALLAMVLK